MSGTRVEGVVEKVSDGDTVRVTAMDRLWKVRVMGLDTEESNAGSSKPITDWGKAASEYAKQVLPVGSPVTIELPGDEPAIVDGEININYLDNFERPLGFLLLPEPVDGVSDFSELMIRKGYSPYFVKYGRAVFSEKDAAYQQAELAAQREDLGVWNQFASNGVMKPEDAPRNYPRLMVWWELRARIIDQFRSARASGNGDLLNTRLDYLALKEKAAAGEGATVFMELVEGETVGGLHYVIKTASRAQPFKLFLPNEDRDEIRAIKNLLRNRYVADGEDFPRRNYAYISGPMKLFNDRPEMVVESVDQISDTPANNGS